MSYGGAALRCFRWFVAGAYLSESANLCHALAGTLSVKPSRSVVSRTRITPLPLAVSTQDPPLLPLKLLLRQSSIHLASFPAACATRLRR
jgi:hypothetical protein